MAQTIPGNEAWRNVPYLNWNSVNRKVKLNANWDDNRNYNWACPVVVRRDCSAEQMEGELALHLLARGI